MLCWSHSLNNKRKTSNTSVSGSLMDQRRVPMTSSKFQSGLVDQISQTDNYHLKSLTNCMSVIGKMMHRLPSSQLQSLWILWICKLAHGRTKKLICESKQIIKFRLQYGSRKAYDGMKTRIECTFSKLLDKVQVIFATGMLILSMLS